MEQFVIALLFAHDRWDSTTGTIDYGKDALALLDVMRHKQEINGGIVDDVTDAFDSMTGLPFDFPNKGSAARTRPSVVMPAYYELWAQATTDPFWSRAAARGRQLLKDSAHPSTGLLPVRATFDGAAVSAGGSDSFQPESYRSQLNIALDYIWIGGEPWNEEESTRLLKFFTMKGFATYGTSFELKGDTINPAREIALQITNGMTALPATKAPDRADYMQVVWDMNAPSGPVRYYQGLCYLLALLLLSGQFQVY
jgi:oligosaccharide reducing-end xylanase